MPDSNDSKTVPLQVIGDQQHHRARALLEERGLLVKAENPGGAIGPLGLAYGFTNLHGALWVRVEDEDQAREAIERAGLFVTGASRPIVDRSEPNCPTCGGELHSGNRHDEDTCPSCGLQFQWITIHEPPADPTGRRCDECGYELTGNTSGACPECNAPILENADQVVEAATREFGDDAHEHPARPNREPKPIQHVLTWNRIFGASLIGFIVGGVVYSQTASGQATPMLSLEVGAVVGLAVLAALAFLRFLAMTGGTRNAIEANDR